MIDFCFGQCSRSFFHDACVLFSFQGAFDLVLRTFIIILNP
ncbi:hypothetical protein GS8_164 [Geobacillus stearothermophilus]|uniref:Uncharacterized protein n=1 Tax=Geobacillus stearothermophilus TaxID=1422 RepID=A0ABQ7HJV1_GEOSE|nr:hypothetical protein GS8_164 [Geobacillus stearothermophilus]